MPGLSRFSRKQPSTAAPTNGGDDGNAAAKVGDGGSVPAGAAATSNGQPSASGGNAEQSNGGDNVPNFSALVDRPSTGGSNTFADFGNMFAMAEQNTGVNSNNMLDSSAFLSSTPTEGLGDVGASLNNNMLGDNSFLQGFGSRPSTGEGGNAFQFGGMMDGFNAEEGGVEQRPTTAANGNERSDVDAKRPADAPKTGGVGIGLFAKRRAVSAAPKVAPTQATVAETKTLCPPKNDGLASAASSVANLSQFDTNLLCEENKTESETLPSGNVQIPKSIATGGGDVEDDLTVGTTTSVVVTTMDGVANTQPPAPAAKSPYFTNVAKQSDAAESNEMVDESNPSPSKEEEIIIPGMNMDMNVQKNNDQVGANVTNADETKQDTVLAPKAGSQRVSLSPPDAKINQATTNADPNSIVIPGVTKTSDIDVAQTMVQLGGGTQAENAKTASSIATSTSTTGNQLVNGASTSTASILANNNARGVNRFSTTEKVKFNLPESTATTKTMATMSRTNSTAITPDNRRSLKQTQAHSTVSGENPQTAVTPTPYKPSQLDESYAHNRVIPGMSGAGEQHNDAPNESMMNVELQQPKGVATGDAVQSPTPATKNDASTPKASNLNTSVAYSGSSMLTTHESFDELLSQLGADLTEATDIHNKGNLDLLHLEVALTHAYAKSLQLKGAYVDFLDEVDAVSLTCEALLMEVTE